MPLLTGRRSRHRTLPGPECCRYCLEEIVYSGDYSKACRNTAAGVKHTLHLSGCEKASGKSHPALKPSAQPVHRQERGLGYRQTQMLPVCQPETAEHIPFPLPVTQAGRGGNRLPATQSQESEAAGSTLQSQAAEPPVGSRDPGAPVSIGGGGQGGCDIS